VEIITALQKRNEDTEVKLNNLEQYRRRCCLEFQGIPQTPNENTDDNIVETVKQLGVNISRSDISISHRLSPPSKTYPNPIIIGKFVNQKLRDDIYGKRLKLKTINGRAPAGRSKLFVNEKFNKAEQRHFQGSYSFYK